MTFKKKVYEYYTKNKRDFPWRRTRDPYKILVSEVMLQQTQADRVVTKYNEFVKKFPNVGELAHAPFSAVLTVWQGLGYNKRALLLHRAAAIIDQKHNGKIPFLHQALVALPGVGPSTAGAVLAFSQNAQEIFIETNIRSVFIHEFFADKKDVDDTQLLSLVTQTLDKKNPREWYYALMDYGVHLKKLHKNPSRASAHYATQSRFEGSPRQLRGKIIKAIVENNQIVKSDIEGYHSAPEKINKILTTLIHDGLIKKKGKYFMIP